MAADCQGSVVKGFKVTDASRRRLIGVACSTLLELKRKACQKLQVSSHFLSILKSNYDVIDLNPARLSCRYQLT